MMTSRASSDDGTRQRASRSRRLVRRLRRVALAYVPLTGRGLLVAGLSGFALWRYGFGTLDLVLFVMGMAGLALVTVAAVAVTLATTILKRRIPADTGAPLRLEAGSPIATGFALPALGRWPLVTLRWRVVSPDDLEVRATQRGTTQHETFVATRRGHIDTLVRELVVGDVFGLSALGWHRHDERAVTVLPHVGRLRRAPVVRSLAGAEGQPHPAGTPDGDRMELRRYVPGDSIRHILWKTYARTRTLNVRLPERSVERADKTVAYLVAGDGDEPAAAAARVALERGALGARWRFGADGNEQPVSELGAALDAIVRSGNRPAPPFGLDRFLGLVIPEGEVHCVVFAPARPGPWLERALAAARVVGLRGGLSFVLTTDGVAPPPARRNVLKRFLFEPRVQTETPSDGLALCVRTIAAAGHTVLVLDRASGRAYGSEQQRTWLQHDRGHAERAA